MRHDVMTNKTHNGMFVLFQSVQAGMVCVFGVFSVPKRQSYWRNVYYTARYPYMPYSNLIHTSKTFINC